MGALRRLREQGGVSLVETVIVAALLMVVTVPIMQGMTSVQRTQDVTDRLGRAVTEARIALDRISREVREADGLTSMTAAEKLAMSAQSGGRAWYDTGAVANVPEPGEFVYYFVRVSGSEYSLVRRTDTGEELTMATDLTGASIVSVTGRVLRAAIAVDIGQGAPAESRLETEVLARNAP